MSKRVTDRAEAIDVLRNWRAWILLLLLVGPIVVYMGLGALWLFEHRWLLVAGSIWVGCGLLFAFLAARWTQARHPVLPPIDWDAPNTFSRTDRDAWALVEAEAERGEEVALERLLGVDVYIDTGRRLATRLAAHYHPAADDPIERIPVVELLTALELAAEDLTHLCRQVPGGDMLTPDHWKKAIKVAGYIQRANDIYSYLLPIFSPVTGLVRLGAQQWMTRPAWRNMQQNLLRWFFRAYVNRLGTHLVELYSGRLAIGTEQYRRLTRRGIAATDGARGELPPLTIAVAGARESGKSRLISLAVAARSGDLTGLKARIAASGIDETALQQLASARFVEVPGYTVTPGGESARDRATRSAAVAQAVEADVLLLVVDSRHDTVAADTAFARDWDRWFVEHPAVELPPALAVLTGLDDPGLGSPWSPPYDWEKGQSTREATARVRLNALRTALPPSITEIVAVGLPETGPYGVVEHLLPTLITLSQRAERVALIRHFQQYARRSKARRLVSQVGERAHWLWDNLRSARRPRARSDAS